MMNKYDCKELQKLHELLFFEGISHIDASSKDGLIERIHFNHEGYNYSCINGYGTYGGTYINRENEGLIEMMSNRHNNGDPMGWLTADDVIKYVRGEVEE